MGKYNLFNYFDKSLVRGGDTYVVQKGDSLWKIAKKMNTTVDELIKVNNLKSILIYPDQVLMISTHVPSGAIFFKEYIIKDSDTLEVIANKMNITVDDILSYNDLSKLELKAGEVIIIPYHNMHKVPDEIINEPITTHTITPDDTYLSILQKYDMKLEELVNANSRAWFAPGVTINLK